MRILVIEDEEKVSRFVVRGLAAERYSHRQISNIWLKCKELFWHQQN